MATTTTTTKQAPAYVLTKAGQRYTPRQSTQYGHHTNWEAIKGYLAKHKGAATLEQLKGLKEQLPEPVQANHVPYVNYAVRSGWLAPKQ